MENSTEQNKEPQCYGPRRPSAKVIVMIMMVVVLIRPALGTFSVVATELEFVIAVSASGSVKFLPAV